MRKMLLGTLMFVMLAALATPVSADEPMPMGTWNEKYKIIERYGLFYCLRYTFLGF